MLFTPARTSHATVVQGLRANVLAIDVCARIPVPQARIRLPFAAAGDLPERIREELLGCVAVPVTLLADLVTQLLAIAIRAEERPPAAPAWIEGVIAILQRDYASDCTLESLAARAGVSPSWLAHAFRHATGMTVGDYLRHARTSAAAIALRESDAPIGAIALACGFSDQAHLSRVFRALRGMTPREWRRGERRVTRA
jgi:AraC-like DNA-binding protein